MPLIHAIGRLFADMLFPIPREERELLAMAPEEAYAALPRAAATEEADMRAVFSYADPRVARLVSLIKNKRSADAARIAAYALYRELLLSHDAAKTKSTAAPRPASIPAPIPRTPIILIPMPLSARRLRERGYNQCELICAEIMRLSRDAGSIASNVAGTITVRTDILARTRHTAEQKTKGRDERLEDVRGLFAAKSGVATACFVVIDDVITTGSTMNAAIAALRAAGYSEVLGLALAHQARSARV